MLSGGDQACGQSIRCHRLEQELRSIGIRAGELRQIFLYFFAGGW
jgi:hypothetical protein